MYKLDEIKVVDDTKGKLELFIVFYSPGELRRYHTMLFKKPLDAPDVAHRLFALANEIGHDELLNPPKKLTKPELADKLIRLMEIEYKGMVFVTNDLLNGQSIFTYIKSLDKAELEEEYAKWQSR